MAWLGRAGFGLDCISLAYLFALFISISICLCRTAWTLWKVCEFFALFKTPLFTVCCWSAQKGRSGLLMQTSLVSSKWPLSMPRCHHCTQNGCSDLLWRRQYAQNGRCAWPPVCSKRLFEPASCTVASSACKGAVGACCSRSLFKSAGLGCTVLCSALLGAWICTG